MAPRTRARIHSGFRVVWSRVSTLETNPPILRQILGNSFVLVCKLNLGGSSSLLLGARLAGNRNNAERARDRSWGLWFGSKLRLHA